MECKSTQDPPKTTTRDVLCSKQQRKRRLIKTCVHLKLFCFYLINILIEMKFYDESKLDLNTDMKVTGVVSLGTKSAASATTQGRNKSNKPWKKQSSRSGLHVQLAKKTWDEKMKERKEMKALRERVAALKEKRMAERRA